MYAGVDLSSREPALRVLLALMSLTSVFGMGTGGPSSQSIPTYMDGIQPIIYVKVLMNSNSKIITPTIETVKYFFGDPYRIRTDVNGVRGRCLNHLTNGPLVHLQGLEPGTH